jgi:hypothetical protein
MAVCLLMQWDETKVISLSGMTSVCKVHMASLRILPEFSHAWHLFLQYVEVRVLRRRGA